MNNRNWPQRALRDLRTLSYGFRVGYCLARREFVESVAVAIYAGIMTAFGPKIFT